MERYRFVCTVSGKGGHGAMPEETIDPVMASAMLIHTINGKNVISGTRVEFDSIDGGTRYNIIPETVKISGRLYISISETENYIQKFGDAIKNILASFRADCTSEFIREDF